MEIDYEKNKNEIIEIFKSFKRPGAYDLFEFLDKEGFFKAPCSGGHHLCEVGGLAEHSLNVYRYAMKIAEAVYTKEEFEENKISIAIASLLHDVGKIGDYGKSMYVPNLLKSGKVSASKPFKRNPDLTGVPHSVRSVTLIRQYMNLTEQEEWAIMCHDGLYGEMKYVLQGHETPLYAIVHYADFWCSHFVENVGNDDEEDCNF